MKKLLLLGAAVLTMQAVPAFAEHHEGKKGMKMEKMFDEQDTNKDGSISKDEFTAHALKRFEAMDGDKNGSVTKEEIKAHYEAKKAEWKAKKAAKEADAPKEAPAAE